MFRRNGPKQWKNVHVTHRANVADLIDLDNSNPGGPQKRGFDLLRQVAGEFNTLIQQAQQSGRRVRALGSGWALTDIAITDGWLLNTKFLNGCFDVMDELFDPSYPQAKRPYLVLAQCGISIGELNIHLELTATSGFKRALKTSGIGAGQTVVGAISGNTHGAAVNFGATPDYVVGIQIVTGNGRSLWIERASQPILNDEFLTKLDADRIRDDDVFNAAVVSFGAFGVITAIAIETDPIYDLKFPPVNDISHVELQAKLDNFDSNQPPGLYHYEFIFNPYSKNKKAMEALATREDYIQENPAPKPVWIVRNDHGFALGDKAGSLLPAFPFVSSAEKVAMQFKRYRKMCILGDIRATPGQLFTATITYLEGFTETAMGVSINDASKMMEISSEVIRQMDLPAMSQVRVVHPSKALLGFTCLGPKTVVFEFGLANGPKYAQFEQQLTTALSAAGIGYTFHWSKNSGITPERLLTMYGAERIAKWRAARLRVFQNDAAFMHLFDNGHVVRAGLHN